jgi:hypothetical protein
MKDWGYRSVVEHCEPLIPRTEREKGEERKKKEGEREEENKMT